MAVAKKAAAKTFRVEVVYTVTPTDSYTPTLKEEKDSWEAAVRMAISEPFIKRKSFKFTEVK